MRCDGIRDGVSARIDTEDGGRGALGRSAGARVRRFTALALLLVAAVAGGVALDVLTARPALAHATLVATDPTDGARLTTAPAEVSLEFSEGVSLASGYLRVLGDGGERVDTGTATADGGVVSAPLRGGLPEASYVVTYRVVSDDAHPIAGAYAFVVGDGELLSPAAVDAGDGTDPAVAGALPVVRWLGFAGTALAIGVPVFLLVCWPAGWGVPRMRRLTSAGLAAVAAGGTLTFLVQGPYAAGAGLGALFDPSLMAATASTAFGVTVLARVFFAVALALLLRSAWRRATSPAVPQLAVLGLLAVGLIVAVAAVGHPAAGPLPGLAIPVTAVHVAAMAVWLGGLTALLTGVLRPGAPMRNLLSALPRYSALAFGAVVALVVTGVLQSVREVGSPSALVSTTYGWLLSAKLVLVLVLLGVAGVSRVWVQQHLGATSRPAPRPRVTAHAFAAAGGEPGTAGTREEEADGPELVPVDDVGPIRRSVLAEAVIGLAVLAVSAVLVGTPPARSSVAEPIVVTAPLQSDAGSAPLGSAQISVDPATAGPNNLDVTLLDEAGQPLQPQEVQVTLTEAEQQIGPLDVPVVSGGPGHVLGNGMSIPSAGTWTITVLVRIDEFTSTSAATDIRVR